MTTLVSSSLTLFSLLACDPKWVPSTSVYRSHCNNGPIYTRPTVCDSRIYGNNRHPPTCVACLALWPRISLMQSCAEMSSFVKRIFNGKNVAAANGHKCHGSKLQNERSSPNITGVTTAKSRRIRWAGHTKLLVKEINAHTIIAGKPEGMRPLRRPMRRW
jgi:hypothetical protein